MFEAWGELKEDAIWPRSLSKSQQFTYYAEWSSQGENKGVLGSSEQD